MESRERDEILRYLKSIRRGKYAVLPEVLTNCSEMSLRNLAKDPQKSTMPEQVGRYVGRAYLTKYLTGNSVNTISPSLFAIPLVAGMFVPAIAPIAVAGALIVGTAGILLKRRGS